MTERLVDCIEETAVDQDERAPVPYPDLGAASCAQTDLETFFSENKLDSKVAKRVCAGCEVAAACLSYALANDEPFGIWGGKTPSERRKLGNGPVGLEGHPATPDVNTPQLRDVSAPKHSIRTRLEILANILETVPNTPEFYSLLRYYFGWNKNGTPIEQKVECYRLVRAKGYSYLAAARTVGITRDATMRAVKALDVTPEELQRLILESDHSAVLDEVV